MKKTVVLGEEAKMDADTIGDGKRGVEPFTDNADSIFISSTFYFAVFQP